MASKRAPRRNLKAAVARPRNDDERALAEAVRETNARFSQITFPQIEKLNELAAAAVRRQVSVNETLALFARNARDAQTTLKSFAAEAEARERTLKTFAQAEARARDVGTALAAQVKASAALAESNARQINDLMESLLAKHAARCGVQPGDHRALALALAIDVERRNRRHDGPVTLPTLIDWMRPRGRPAAKK
jgi:hypothetical protein